MERRDFFKTLIATPLLAPYLLASESSKSAFQLYVISDTPQLFFPSLLRGLDEYGLIPGRSYTLLNYHPEEKELRKALFLAGWKYTQQTSEADFCISFSLLHRKSSPSFTLIKSGKVWDIRSRKLYSLWKKMSARHSPSSLLTTVCLKEKRGGIQDGTYASIYIDGRKVERLR